MVSDKLTAKIKKIPYCSELSIIDRRRPDLLDACLALGRVDLIRSFYDQAFTEEILDKYYSTIAQYIRNNPVESTRLSEYYFRRRDLKTAFRCLGEKSITRPFLERFGKLIIEGLKKPKYISYGYFGDSKILYKYLLENKEYGLAFSDDFYRFNKNLIKKTGVSLCADAIEEQHAYVPSSLVGNVELFNEFLRRRNFYYLSQFNNNLLTEELINQYKMEFVETILRTRKVGRGISNSRVLAEYFRAEKKYKLLSQFYGYSFDLTNEEINSIVHEIDVSRLVAGVYRNNEKLFRYYLDKKDAEILFQFDHDLINKYDAFNKCINEVINMVRSTGKLHYNYYLSDEDKVSLIEHDAVDVIIQMTDSASYSLISNEAIMNKYGERILESVKALGLDEYNVNDPLVFKCLLKYKKYEYLLRANEKIFKRFITPDDYPELANYLKDNKEKFNKYLRNSKSFFNYCLENKYYDLLLSFQDYIFTEKKAAGIEDKIIDCILNDVNYPNMFRENELLYYHLYDYALEHKRYNFIFEHCGSKAISDILGGMYDVQKWRELSAAYFEITGLNRAELEQKYKALYKVNDDVLTTINAMILSHKYDILDESVIQRFTMYPDIQKRIISLNEYELKALNILFKKITSKKVKIDRSNLIDNVIKNLHKYEKIIREIDFETINDDLLEKLLCLLNDSNNYYMINSLSDLMIYDEMVLKKYQIVEEQILSKKLDIFGLREAVFRKKFGISLEEARFIFDRYCSDMDAINDSSLSNEVKIVLNEVKKVFSASKDELGFMFLSSKVSIANKHKYDSLEAIIRTNYAKLFNDVLYKPKEEDKVTGPFKDKYLADVKVPVYLPSGDFNMQLHSLGAYRKFDPPENWKNDWNRPKTAYHGICTVFIENDMIATARSFHPIYGFSSYKENEMLCAGNYDLYSDRAIAKFDTSRAYPYSFYPPKHFINKTRHSHNEIVIERVVDGVKRQPDYVVYIVDDINDSRFFHPQNVKFREIVQAAEDHNIPIIIVDRLQQAKRSMVMIEKMKREMAEDFEKFANEGKVQELLFKYLNNRIGCYKHIPESKSEIYNYFTDEICVKAINDIWAVVSAAPDSSAKCKALKQLIYVLANEHTSWSDYKLSVNSTGWILNEATVMLANIDIKYRQDEEVKQNASLNKRRQQMYIYKIYADYPELRPMIKQDLSNGIELNVIIEKINNVFATQTDNFTSTSRGGGRQ